METELKLRVEPDSATALYRHPMLRSFAASKPRTQQLTSHYFDTPDHYFHRHSAALRVRRVDRRWVQTLKAGPQPAAGLAQRHEWESIVARPLPDLIALRANVDPDSVWADALGRPEFAPRLLSIFTTHVRRTSWKLQLEDGSQIELALDRGEIRDGAHSVPISEIELELKAGHPRALFELALRLLAEVPLRVEARSKSERGYALLAPQSSAIVRAMPIELSFETTTEQAFVSVIGNCLAQVQGNETAVIAGPNPESIHQMRVGLRRLRFALRLFRPMAPCPAPLLAELKWLAAELGNARDWTVFEEVTLPTIMQSCPAETELTNLQQSVADTTREHESAAAAAVRSGRYTRLLLDLGCWMQGLIPAPTSLSAPPPSLQKFSTKTLKFWRRRLLVQSKAMGDDGTDASRHQMRIAVKKLRYATEFLAALFLAKRVRPFVRALVALQDELGRHNDSVVGIGLLRQLAAERPELASPANFVQGYLVATMQGGHSRSTRIWKKFLDLDFPLKK